MKQELNGKDTLTFYDEDIRDELVDADEISSEEAGFMKGYDEAEEFEE